MKNFKNTFFIIISIVSFILFSISCKKDDKQPTEPPAPPVETVKDANGNSYGVVTIGSQKWLSSNMKVDIQGSFHIDGNTSLTSTYGKLYNNSAALLACPSGWKLPSKEDYEALVQHLGGESTAGGKMKNAGTTYWQTPNTGGNNESGFNALPAGYRNSSDGVYFGKGMYGYLWTSTQCGT